VSRPQDPGDLPAGHARCILVPDACVLINFLKLDRLDLLTSAMELSPMTTKLVLDEITDRGQRQALDEAVNSGKIEVADPDSARAMELYLDLREGGLGKGEASCLGLCCITGGAILACDERAGCFLRAVSKLDLREHLVTTRDLINLAVQDGRLTLGAANRLLGDLRTRFRYNSDDLQSGEDLPPAFEKFGSGLR
jgi:predicted nucleic acid-binding protein